MAAGEHNRKIGELAQIIDLAELPSGAHPMPFVPLGVGEVPRCRNMDCGEYARCLSFVATLRWRGFHCKKCPFFRPESERPRRASDDDLLAAVIQLRMG